MTPKQLAKSGTEHAHQVALFAYCAIACRYGWEIADLWATKGLLLASRADLVQPIPALEWLHAIPNGGSRGDSAKSAKIRGAQLKAEGVKPGIPDIFLPFPCRNKCGLYIEMKRPSLRPKRPGSAGGMSDHQIRFAQYANRVGYEFATCYTWDDAVVLLKSYIG